jgi:hypothetical protein
VITDGAPERVLADRECAISIECRRTLRGRVMSFRDCHGSDPRKHGYRGVPAHGPSS